MERARQHGRETGKRFNYFKSRRFSTSSRFLLRFVSLLFCLGCMAWLLSVSLANMRILVLDVNYSDDIAAFNNSSEAAANPLASDDIVRLPPAISKLFNETCPVDYLGLPDAVAVHCPATATDTRCRNLTCRNLLATRDDGLLAFARDFMTKHPRRAVDDTQFVTWTKDCADFRRRRGFLAKSTPDGDFDFSIAFNFIVHRNAEQVERLLYALYRPQHRFCIHVDRGSRSQFKLAMEGIARCLSPSVFLTAKQERIIYAGFSRLQADLNCMRDHVTRGGPWRYLLNTAGEAFPLRSQQEMIQILRLYNGTNDIEGIHGARLKPRRYLFESEFMVPEGHNQVERMSRRNPLPPHDFDIVKGSAYGAFSRGFVEFVLGDGRARDLLEWMKRTYSPDELYWHTLHHRYANPHVRAPGGIETVPSQKYFSAVYANWGDEPCRGTFIHFICVNGVGDLRNLVTRRELFVNKFYEGFEPLALDCMRAWLEHKNACPVDFNFDFYRTLSKLSKREALHIS